MITTEWGVAQKMQKIDDLLAKRFSIRINHDQLEYADIYLLKAAAKATVDSDFELLGGIVDAASKLWGLPCNNGVHVGDMQALDIMELGVALKHQGAFVGGMLRDFESQINDVATAMAQLFTDDWGIDLSELL